MIVLYRHVANYAMLQCLIARGDAAITSAPTEDITAQLEKEVQSLKNESVEGSFNNPTSEPCKHPL